ncbi:hypothetical protein [Aerococcus urinaeequi]|uniref:hypothetical protein n=1 Tax=Aerococcus urinaeequi TaxID=51665 RepID=UPI000845F7EC|nr:hypothetical protein [Aerococcus urinaeequi]
MREYAKVNRIVSEFMNLFDDYEINKYQMEMSIATDKQSTSVIKFDGKKTNLPHSFVDQLNELNAKRQPEIEYYYEDLLGIRNDTFNTEILAAVIDYVTFDVTDTDFQIYIERVYH